MEEVCVIDWGVESGRDVVETINKFVSFSLCLDVDNTARFFDFKLSEKGFSGDDMAEHLLSHDRLSGFFGSEKHDSIFFPDEVFNDWFGRGGV